MENKVFSKSRGITLGYPIHTKIHSEIDLDRRDNAAFFTGYICALVDTPEQAENITAEEKIAYVLMAKAKAEYLRRERAEAYSFEEAKEIVKAVYEIENEKLNRK